jgi:hypothetical protein
MQFYFAMPALGHFLVARLQSWSRAAPEIFRKLIAFQGVLHINNFKNLTCPQNFNVFNTYLLPFGPLIVS